MTNCPTVLSLAGSLCAQCGDVTAGTPCDLFDEIREDLYQRCDDSTPYCMNDVFRSSGDTNLYKRSASLRSISEPDWPSGKVGKQRYLGSNPLRISFLFKSCGLWTLSFDFFPHNLGNIKMSHIAAHLNA